MFVLRDYQKNLLDKLVNYNDKRCCISLATGGGKTVLFIELINHIKGSTLILVHREELVHQTSKTIKKEHDILIPKVNEVSKDICVAMVQTLWNRIKKGSIDINSYDNLIIDECHRGEFIKILDIFDGKVFGFTATPNYEKTSYYHVCNKCGNKSEQSIKCCGKQMLKYKEKVPLKKYYNELIHGIDIPELIEQGYLVPDEHFVLENKLDGLVWDAQRGDYTDESKSLVFGSPEAISNSIDVYYQLAKGKKTIIFNPNTLVNEKLFNEMYRLGLPVKMYDSVNSEEDRLNLVEWFKNTPSAILLNVHVFTTGFDVTDVEVIFLNKKTKSINLYIQMVGRGGRITDKIFKPKFKVIDMGDHLADFGKWSDRRNWNKYFNDNEIKPIKEGSPASVRTCHHCESIVAANSLRCPVCNAEKIFKGSVTGIPKIDGKFIIPKPDKIIQYCLENNLDCLSARKIIYNYVAEMFQDVSFENYRKNKASGKLFEKAKTFLIPYYFSIQNSRLKGNKVRTLNSFVNETIKTIDKYYERR